MYKKKISVQCPHWNSWDMKAVHWLAMLLTIYCGSVQWKITGDDRVQQDFEVLCDFLLNQYQQHEIYLLYIIKRQTTTDKAFLDVFQNKSSKVGLRPLWRTQESSLTIVCLYKMKQSHWLLCTVKNWDWSRKITPLKNLSWA